MKKIVSRFGLVQPRYLYVIDVGNSIKLGSTNTLQRRMNSLGGEWLFLLKGPTKDIAELERDTLIKFEKYSKHVGITRNIRPLNSIYSVMNKRLACFAPKSRN